MYQDAKSQCSFKQLEALCQDHCQRIQGAAQLASGCSGVWGGIPGEWRSWVVLLPALCGRCAEEAGSSQPWAVAVTCPRSLRRRAGGVVRDEGVSPRPLFSIWRVADRCCPGCPSLPLLGGGVWGRVSFWFHPQIHGAVGPSTRAASLLWMPRGGDILTCCCLRLQPRETRSCLSEPAGKEFQTPSWVHCTWVTEQFM